MTPASFPGQEARSTHRALLDTLKREGPRDARALSVLLGISPMAVRLHLYQLRDEKLVTYAEERRPMGRPGKLWRLTNAAGRLFPDRHRDAAVHLLDAVRAAFGGRGLARVLSSYGRAQVRRYLRRMRRGGSLLARLRALCTLRSDEDYMAAVEPFRDGGFMLVQNHCPISAAAASHGELCAAEQAIFQAVLGRSVVIERCEHILAGAARCSYRISKRPKTAAWAAFRRAKTV